MESSYSASSITSGSQATYEEILIQYHRVVECTQNMNNYYVKHNILLLDLVKVYNITVRLVHMLIHFVC